MVKAGTAALLVGVAGVAEVVEGVGVADTAPQEPGSWSPPAR